MSPDEMYKYQARLSERLVKEHIVPNLEGMGCCLIIFPFGALALPMVRTNATEEGLIPILRSVIKSIEIRKSLKN